MKRLLFVLVLLALTSSAEAASLTQANQLWASTTVQGNIGSRFSVMLDLHARFYTNTAPFWMLVRPAVGLRLIPGMYVWLGYGYTPTWNSAGQYIDEQRAWQQWNYDIPNLPAGLKLHLRTRFEQRVRPELSDEVGVRFRQMARLIAPFDPRYPVHISVWDEIFFAFNTASNRGINGAPWQRAGFDQNRFFVGPGVFVHRTTRIELGYFQQLILQGDRVVLHHALALNVGVTIP